MLNTRSINGSHAGCDKPAIENKPTILGVGFGHRTKQFAILDGCGGNPGIDRLFDPQRNGDGTNPAAFPAQVGDDPPPLSELDFVNVKVCQFTPAQGTADKQGENAVIALTFERRTIWYRKQFLCLLACQSVSHSSSSKPNVRHIRHLGRLLRVDYAISPRFAYKLADG